MTKIRFIRLPLMIPTWAVGQVLLPRTVFYRGKEPDSRIIAHELKHVMQIEQMGLLAYWAQHVRHNLLGGYVANPLEQEAYRAETDVRFIEVAFRIVENWKIQVSQTHDVDLRLLKGELV